jgi:lysophospholipase L1-like esterase
LLLAGHRRIVAVMLRIHDRWVVSWQAGSGAAVLLPVAPPVQVNVEGEEHVSLPEGLGASLRSIREGLAVVQDRLDPLSLRVRSCDGGVLYEPHRDYLVDPTWAVVGRTPDGRISADTRVRIDYRYGLSRLDTVLVDASGNVALRQGDSRLPRPRPPELLAGERALANVWIPGRQQQLTADCLFPILEDRCPPLPADRLQCIGSRLPRTLAKLRAGEPLRIMAWGDSVTAGGWVPLECRWHQRFAAALRAAVPGAKIDLVTSAWGGKQSGEFLADPRNAEHPYPGALEGTLPDLVVSLFVNDAKSLTGLAALDRQYGRYRDDFGRMGAEWLIVTPHYTCPEWMGFVRQRDIDGDPRPYVVALRQFAEAHGIAIADASRHWGRLWRRGIPYTIYLSNGVNHPDAQGMEPIADAVLEILLGSGSRPARRESARPR